MHTGPVPGKFTTASMQVENTGMRCRECGSNNIKYRKWESDCGGYEDYCYKCESCGLIWWVEGIDS